MHKIDATIQAELLKDSRFALLSHAEEIVLHDGLLVIGFAKKHSLSVGVLNNEETQLAISAAISGVKEVEFTCTGGESWTSWLEGYRSNQDIIIHKNALVNIEKINQLRREIIGHLCSLSYTEYLKTDHWKIQRQRALSRAGYLCVLCLSTARHVHHKTYDRRGDETPEDLIALCENCHGKFHDKEP